MTDLLDVLSLTSAEAEAFLRGLYGEPQPAQRAPLPPLPLKRQPAALLRRAGSTTSPVGIGDRVQMLDDGREGVVIRIKSGQYGVLFGWEDNRWARREEFEK